MKIVRENIGFHRSEDPLKQMGIGSPYKNPMPELNHFIKNELKDPVAFSWTDLNEQMDIARRGLIDFTLFRGMHEEFGNYIKSFGKHPEYGSRKLMVLDVPVDGKSQEIEIMFNPSNEYTSFYAYIGDPVKDSGAYSRSVKALAKGIRKKLKEKGIII